MSSDVHLSLIFKIVIIFGTLAILAQATGHSFALPLSPVCCCAEWIFPLHLVRFLYSWNALVARKVDPKLATTPTEARCKLDRAHHHGGGPSSFFISIVSHLYFSMNLTLSVSQSLRPYCLSRLFSNDCSVL